MFNQLLGCELSADQAEVLAAIVIFSNAQAQFDSIINDNVKEALKILRLLPSMLVRELSFEVLARAKK